MMGAPIQSKELYGEKHHVLPSSLFPGHKKNKLNLKRISAKDHFIAHYLLWKAYPETWQMMFAFKMMFDMYKQTAEPDIMMVHSLEYEQAKIIHAQWVSKSRKGIYTGEKHNWYGKEFTQEHKDRISKGKMGNTAFLGRKHTDEAKKKMSAAAMGNTKGKAKGKKITFGGITLTTPEWSAKLGIDTATIQYRLKTGWTIEEALTTPVKPPKHITFNGKTLGMSEWAKEVGISPNTFHPTSLF